MKKADKVINALRGYLGKRKAPRRVPSCLITPVRIAPT